MLALSLDLETVQLYSCKRLPISSLQGRTSPVCSFMRRDSEIRDLCWIKCKMPLHLTALNTTTLWASAHGASRISASIVIAPTILVHSERAESQCVMSAAICAFIRSLNPRPQEPMKALTRTGMSGQKPLATMALYWCVRVSLCSALANKHSH